MERNRRYSEVGISPEELECRLLVFEKILALEDSEPYLLEGSLGVLADLLVGAEETHMVAGHPDLLYRVCMHLLDIRNGIPCAGKVATKVKTAAARAAIELCKALRKTGKAAEISYERMLPLTAPLWVAAATLPPVSSPPPSLPTRTPRKGVPTPTPAPSPPSDPPLTALAACTVLVAMLSIPRVQSSASSALACLPSLDLFAPLSTAATLAHRDPTAAQLMVAVVAACPPALLAVRAGALVSVLQATVAPASLERGGEGVDLCVRAFAALETVLARPDTCSVALGVLGATGAASVCAHAHAAVAVCVQRLGRVVAARVRGAVDPPLVERQRAALAPAVTTLLRIIARIYSAGAATPARAQVRAALTACTIGDTAGVAGLVAGASAGPGLLLEALLEPPFASVCLLEDVALVPKLLALTTCMVLHAVKTSTGRTRDAALNALAAGAGAPVDRGADEYTGFFRLGQLLIQPTRDLQRQWSQVVGIAALLPLLTTTQASAVVAAFFTDAGAPAHAVLALHTPAAPPAAAVLLLSGSSRAWAAAALAGAARAGGVQEFPGEADVAAIAGLGAYLALGLRGFKAAVGGLFVPPACARALPSALLTSAPPNSDLWTIVSSRFTVAPVTVAEIPRVEAICTWSALAKAFLATKTALATPLPPFRARPRAAARQQSRSHAGMVHVQDPAIHELFTIEPDLEDADTPLTTLRLLRDWVGGLQGAVRAVHAGAQVTAPGLAAIAWPAVLPQATAHAPEQGACLITTLNARRWAVWRTYWLPVSQTQRSRLGRIFRSDTSRLRLLLDGAGAAGAAAAGSIVGGGTIYLPFTIGAITSKFNYDALQASLATLDVYLPGGAPALAGAAVRLARALAAVSLRADTPRLIAPGATVLFPPHSATRHVPPHRHPDWQRSGLGRLVAPSAARLAAHVLRERSLIIVAECPVRRACALACLHRFLHPLTPPLSVLQASALPNQGIGVLAAPQPFVMGLSPQQLEACGSADDDLSVLSAVSDDQLLICNLDTGALLPGFPASYVDAPSPLTSTLAHGSVCEVAEVARVLRYYSCLDTGDDTMVVFYPTVAALVPQWRGLLETSMIRALAAEMLDRDAKNANSGRWRWPMPPKPRYGWEEALIVIIVSPAAVRTIKRSAKIFYKGLE